MEVNIHYAKTHLSRLIEKAMLGEDVVIARAGKPMARLVSIAARGKQRRLGSARGQIWFGKGRDAPLMDEEIGQLTGE